MKSFLTLAFLVFSVGLGIGQVISNNSDDHQCEKCEQVALINEAEKVSWRLESLKPIDELLRSGLITDPELKIKLLGLKMYYYHFHENLFQPNTEKWGNKVVIPDSLDAFFRFTDSVIDMAGCNWQAELMLIRYLSVNVMNVQSGYKLGDDINSFLKSEKKKINYFGWLPEKDGLGIGIGYMKGNENWVGVELSLINFYIPSYSYVDTCEGKPVDFKRGFLIDGYNLLNFGYYASINSNIHDYSISLLEMYSSLVIIPAKFGFQKNVDLQMNSYYYRPSIGLGIGPVGIYYSYNLMFSKEMRPYSEKHLLQIRINYPVFRNLKVVSY